MTIHIEAFPENNNLNMKCNHINSVLVVYHSETNHMKNWKLLARVLKIVMPMIPIVQLCTNVTYEQLVQSSAIAIGFSLLWKSIMVTKFIDDTFTFQGLERTNFENIPATVFSTGGSFDGTESTLSSLGRFKSIRNAINYTRHHNAIY